MTNKPIRDLHALMYSSIADPKLKRDDIDLLVNAARRRNAEQGITGLLVYQQGCFLQILEGDRKKLSHLFEQKLLRDPRHSAVRLFHDEALSERQFRFWHLAFSDLGEQTTRISLPYRERLKSERGLYELNTNTAMALALVRQIHRRVLCAQKPESLDPDTASLQRP